MTHLQRIRALDRPAKYRICSLGILDASWSDYFGAMTINHVVKPDEGHVTTLTGRLADQAELMGVLNHLYDMGLSLISVECLRDKPPGSAESVVDRSSPQEEAPE